MIRKPAHQSKHNRPYGFTLVEVLVTLVVIGIMAAVTAPALMDMAPNMSLKSASRDLLSNLQSAKTRAIKENTTITIRFDTPGIFYRDDNGDGIHQAGEPFVLLGEDPNGNDTLDAGEDLNGNGRWDRNHGVGYGSGVAGNNFDIPPVAITQATSITFDSRGLATITPIAPPGAAVYIDNEDNTNSYAADVSPAGSVRIHRFNGAIWNP